MGSVGLMRIVGHVPCDHPNCHDGRVTVRGTNFTCPTCAGSSMRPVYEPTGRAITIQGVPSRVVTRSEHLGDS